MRRPRQRGSAFLHVLIAFVVLGAFAEVWRSSFRELNRSASRDPDRARAREIAEAAWTRARQALERGEAAASSGQLLGGVASVEARALGSGAWEVRVRASVDHVPRGSRRDPIACELVIHVTVEKGRAHVTARQERGA